MDKKENSLEVSMSTSRNSTTEILDSIGRQRCEIELTKKGLPRKRRIFTESVQERKAKKIELRKERHKVKEPCKKTCKNNCPTKISKERQTFINEKFWNLNPRDQRWFIQEHTSSHTPKRRRSKSTKRSRTTKYELSDGNGLNSEVCKIFFLATLGFEKNRDTIVRNVCHWNAFNSFGAPQEDKRGKHSSKKSCNNKISSIEKSIENNPNEDNIQNLSRIILETLPDDIVDPGDGEILIREGSSSSIILETLPDDIVDPGDGETLIKEGNSSSIILETLPDDIVVPGNGKTLIKEGDSSSIILETLPDDIVDPSDGKTLIKEGNSSRIILETLPDDIVDPADGKTLIKEGNPKRRKVKKRKEDCKKHKRKGCISKISKEPTQNTITKSDFTNSDVPNENESEIPPSILKTPEIIDSIVPNELTKKGTPRKRRIFTESVQERKAKKIELRKEQHKVKEPCKETCKNNCPTKISKERQTFINEKFWNLNSRDQRWFIQGHTTSHPPERRRGKSPTKSRTTKYRLTHENGVNLQVCKVFFLATLGYEKHNDCVVRNVCHWKANTNFSEPQQDKRGKHSSRQSFDKTEIENHINSLMPKKQLNYRQKHAPNRVYFPNDMTIRKMHLDFVATKNMNVSYEVYRKVVATKNISFIKIKKQHKTKNCQLCEKYEIHQTTNPGHNKEEQLTPNCDVCVEWNSHRSILLCWMCELFEIHRNNNPGHNREQLALDCDACVEWKSHKCILEEG